MKAYIDSDIILDVFLARERFVNESSQILSLCENRHIIGCSTALAVANIYYIMNRFDKSKSKKAIKYLRDILKILPVTDNELARSLDSKFTDFEDGIQNFTAENAECDIIITRNVKDYKTSKLEVKTAAEFLLLF